MPSPRGLRLLSLDGGGCRALSELLVLKEILERLKARDGFQEIPYPCDYFDMIAGSNTGGILALMLGRLRMSIEDSITAYISLASSVFSDTKWTGTERFKSSKLEEVLQDIVRGVTGNGESRMIDNSRCKVFVCAMSAHTISPGIPCLFRTYADGSGANESYNCTIWEAARATTAYPLFFKPVRIGPPGLEEPFVDGSLGCNNPLDMLFEAAGRVFPARHVSCIISLGAGQRPPISALSSSDVQRAVHDIARDCDGVANAAELHFRDLDNVYFRFNVPHGLHATSHDDWDQWDIIKAQTDSYTNDVQTSKRLVSAVEAISIRRLGVISTKQLRRYQPSIQDGESILSSAISIFSLSRFPPLPSFGMPSLYSQKPRDPRSASHWLKTMIAAARSRRSRGAEISKMRSVASEFLESGRYKEAKDTFRDVLISMEEVTGVDHPSALKIRYLLGLSIFKQDRYKEAERTIVEAGEMQKQVRGEHHPETLDTYFLLAELLMADDRKSEAEAAVQVVISARTAALGNEHVDVLKAEFFLANLLDSRGEYATAGGIYRRVLSVQEDRLHERHPDVLSTMHALGASVLHRGESREAEAILVKVLGLREAVLGHDHPDTLRSRHYLAESISSQNRFGEAETMFAETLTALKRVLGREHLQTMMTQFSLALSIQRTQGRPHDVEAMLRATLITRQRILGRRHGDTQETQLQLGEVLCDPNIGRTVEADELFMDVWNVRKSSLGEQPQTTLEVLEIMVQSLTRNDRSWKLRRMCSRDLLKLRIPLQKEALGDKHPNVLRSEHDLATLLRHHDIGQYEEAEKIHRATLESRRQVLGEDHLETLESWEGLSAALSELGRYAEAEETYRDLLAAQKRFLGKEYPETLETEKHLADSSLNRDPSAGRGPRTELVDPHEFARPVSPLGFDAPAPIDTQPAQYSAEGQEVQDKART